MNGLWLAIGFLTVLPVRTPPPQPGGPAADLGLTLGRAGAWFSVVGLGLGALLAAAHFLLAHLFPASLTAALVVALWAALTGGLHLDGLADCCDGLLASVSPERRLEIMRDPRLGAFGGAGLTLFLILKVLAVASLTAALSFWAFIFSAALARWLILLVALQPAARPGGLGADFARGITPSILALAALTPLILVALGGWRALMAVVVAGLVTVAIVGLARARLGGVTGDVFGLTVELTELAALLVFAARFPPTS